MIIVKDNFGFFCELNYTNDPNSLCIDETNEQKTFHCLEGCVCVEDTEYTYISLKLDVFFF